MISFYILSERFRLKGKGISNAKVGLLRKKEYVFAVHYFKDL